MIPTTREELESYIDEIEGDLEVQSLLSPVKRLDKESIKALEDSLAKAREQLAALPPEIPPVANYGMIRFTVLVIAGLPLGTYPGGQRVTVFPDGTPEGDIAEEVNREMDLPSLQAPTIENVHARLRLVYGHHVTVNIHRSVAGVLGPLGPEVKAEVQLGPEVFPWINHTPEPSAPPTPASPKVYSSAIIPFECHDGTVRDVRVSVDPVSSPIWRETPCNSIVLYSVLGGREVRVTLEVL